MKHEIPVPVETTFNIPALIDLRGILERAGDDEFRMSEAGIVTECGTVGCIAGNLFIQRATAEEKAAAMRPISIWNRLRKRFRGAKVVAEYSWGHVAIFARRHLGLSAHEAEHLFHGAWGPRQLTYDPNGRITPRTRAEAIAQIDKMIATGRM